MRVFTALTLTAVAILYLNLTSATWFISPDSTDYVEGARSLARLDGFLDATGAPETIIPPGTSAVYAVAALVPSANYFSFNLVTKLLTIGFVVFAYLMVRRAAGDGVALLIVLFLALNERLILESTRILSDIPFAAAVMLTAWLFPQEKLEGLSARAALALGGFVALGYVLRTAGVFVYLGYVIYIALWVRTNRLRTIVVMTTVFGLVAGTLWLRARLEGAAHSYAQLLFLKRSWVMDSGFPTLGDWYDRITANTATTLRYVYVAFSNDGRLLPGGVVLCLLLIVGLAAELMRRRGSLHLCCLICYFPLLVLPSYRPEPRYMLPILPFLALIAVSGARAVVGWLASDRAKLVALGALIAVIVVNPYWTNGAAFARGMRAELTRANGVPVMYRGHERFVELVERQRGTLTPADAVTTMHANILKYFLPPGTPVSSYSLTEDVEKLHRWILDGPTTVVYCDKTAENWRYLEPVLRAHPESFELEAENQHAAIYRVRR